MRALPSNKVATCAPQPALSGCGAQKSHLLACRLRSFNAMQILKLLPCQGLIDSGHPVSKLRMPLPRVVIEERIVRNVNRRHWMVSTVLLADQRLQGDRRLTILGNEEIGGQILAWVNAVMVEFALAILQKQRIVDAEVSGELACGLGKDDVGGIGNDVCLAACAHQLVPAQKVCHGRGCDGRARPKRVDGDTMRL